MKIYCPWCRKEVIVDDIEYGTDYNGDFWYTYYIECTNKKCPVQPKSKEYDTREDAIANWIKC